MKRRWIYLILLLTFLILPVNAQRTSDNNYGVNKKWNITKKNLDNILATPEVNANDKIYDYANLLSEEDKIYLKTRIDEYINLTSMDLVIITDTQYFSNDKKYEDFVADFYDYNDFGINFENYSGVVLYRTANRQDPYYNMYMFGKAQLYYPYPERTEPILDDIYNDIHLGYYLEGFERFISELTRYYNYGIPSVMEEYKLDSRTNALIKPYEFNFYLTILIPLILGICITQGNVKKHKMIKIEATADNYLNNAEDIHWITRQDILTGTHTTRHYIDTSSSSGGGSSSSSHSSSFGSSGGGHSSGGGRHG